jgi:hypothetical protein
MQLHIHLVAIAGASMLGHNFQVPGERHTATHTTSARELSRGFTRSLRGLACAPSALARGTRYGGAGISNTYLLHDIPLHTFRHMKQASAQNRCRALRQAGSAGARCCPRAMHATTESRGCRTARGGGYRSRSTTISRQMAYLLRHALGACRPACIIPCDKRQ